MSLTRQRRDEQPPPHGRGKGQTVQPDKYINPRKAHTDQLILQAWINPLALVRRSEREHRCITTSLALKELYDYCALHIRHGHALPEIEEGLPPRITSSMARQPIFFVRIDRDETICNRVEGQMRRLGFHTAKSKEIYLPSERPSLYLMKKGE